MDTPTIPPDTESALRRGDTAKTQTTPAPRSGGAGPVTKLKLDGGYILDQTGNRIATVDTRALTHFEYVRLGLALESYGGE